MPETKSLTQAQCDRAEEQAIHYLLELLAHKRRTLRCGRLDSALTDIEESARPLPDAVRHFLNRFLIRFFERERSHLRQQIWAAESDSTPPS